MEKLEAVGAVSLVYDHNTRVLSDKLAEHRHSHYRETISARHVHLDAHYCLEAVVIKVIKGKAKKVRKLSKS